MRIEALLAAHARRRPQHPAIVIGARCVDYARLNDSVRRVAWGLRRRGVRAGDRVLVQLPNGAEFVQALYGALSLGALAVPVNVRLTAQEVENIARDCSPVLAVHAPGELAELISAPAGTLPEVPPEADEAIILYTSGTTGKPKGAVITHANMIYQNAFMQAVEWDIRADDRSLANSPLAHRAGIGRVFNAFGLGITLVLHEKFDPLGVIELIERERVTVAGFVPTMLRMMLPHLRERPGRMPSLRRMIVAAESFPEPLRREVAALVPQARLASIYGMTEGSVTILSHEEHFSHPLSAGRPVPGVEVRIVDDRDGELPVGEVGEIVARCGPPGQWAFLKRYWNRPEETAAALRGGWYHTGDLGRLDGDGYLYVVDRKKDMVITGGLNVYCKEVEAALDSHPEVAESAVVGVPDETYGEAVAAFVAARDGTRPSAHALIEHCKARLAGYKKPKHVFFVESLPKNSTGKVIKIELRKTAAERLAATEPRA
jgi:long-chain acyl-CoA synthetase